MVISNILNKGILALGLIGACFLSEKVQAESVSCSLIKASQKYLLKKTDRLSVSLEKLIFSRLSLQNKSLEYELGFKQSELKYNTKIENSINFRDLEMKSLRAELASCKKNCRAIKRTISRKKISYAKSIKTLTTSRDVAKMKYSERLSTYSSQLANYDKAKAELIDLLNQAQTELVALSQSAVGCGS